MSRRRLVVVAIAVVVLALAVLFVMSGSRGGGGKPGVVASRDGTSARAGIGANAPKRNGLSWTAQRGAPARRIAGRVVFEGRPVGGATVRLAARAERYANAVARTTGDDGAFDFGPQEATLLLVSANADGKAGALLHVDLRNPAMRPPSDELVLELRPCAAALHGFILDAASGPIPGASVRRGSIDAIAATDGAYSLCLPIGDTLLDVGADGYGTVSVSMAVTNRVRRDFRLSPEGVIAGRAVRVEDGTPISNALVSLQASGTAIPGFSGGISGAPGSATTDADGRFRMVGVLPGRRQLSATADGYRSRLVDVNVIAGENDEVTVTLEAATTVQGRVVDEAGKPAEGTTITLREGERWRMREADILSAVSQEDGVFAVDGVLPGSYAIDLAPFQETKDTVPSIDVPAGGVKDLTIVVARGSSVAGVVTRSGKPLGGARVYVQNGGGRMQAISEIDGRFLLRGIAPGTHELYGESIQDGAFSRGPTVTVEQGADLKGVAIDLALAGSIAGTVVDQHGTPVSGAYLSFQLVKGGDFGESTTAEDGTFEARALSGGGPYRVSIMASRRSSLRFLPVEGDDFPLVDVAGGDSHVTGVRYAVTVDRLVISGVVVDEKGQPLPDVRVEATPQGDRGWEMGEVPADVTDTDGAFTITNLLAGDYHLRARAGSGAEARPDPPVAAGARNVRIQLATPGQIEGTLAGFARPPRIVARAMRSMRPDESMNGEVTGTTFRVRGLSPGRYVVTAIAGRFAAAQSTVEVKAGQTARVTLTNQGSGAVKGTAMDAEGKPARGARCSLRDESDLDNGVTVDENGAFTIAPAPVGVSPVMCFKFEGTMSSGVAMANVELDKTATVAITMSLREERKPQSTIGVTWVESPAGLRVGSLVDGGPAAKAGMKVRDLLIEIEHIGVDYRNVDSEWLDRIITRQRPGITLKFKLRRGSENVELPVMFAPAEPTAPVE
ncbi:MAG TPA: carboxypeptidase regulatory-like domain-containing protein [Kofleriaceae bacterium]|nr:carboxypeptidase regulatory-like domain-containing protein [Kofleriaceae bacterium]